MEGKPAQQGGGGGATKADDKGKGADQAIDKAMKDGPYVKHDNLEDYKREGYGTEGHQKVEEGRGAGTTEGPTLAGTNVAKPGV